MRDPARHHGLTLAEALMASVLLLVVVAAISQAVVTGQSLNHSAPHAQRAAMLAGEMVERILALPYDDPAGASAPGPESGESTWAQFDNIDDYHGYSEAVGDVRDPSGDLYGGEFSTFSRSVAIVSGAQSVAGFGDPIPGLTVTVTVADRTGKTWTLTRFLAEPIEP